MPAAEQVHLIGRVADAFNAGTLDLIDELVSPSVTGFTRDLAVAKAVFPDASFTIEDVVESKTGWSIAALPRSLSVRFWP